MKLSNSRGVLVLCLLAAVGQTSGCASGRGVQAEKPALLATASTNALAGKYEQAIINYTDFLAGEPSQELKAEAYVGRGKAYFNTGRYELAQADYQAGYTIAKDRSMRAQALTGMANSLSAQDRYDRSEKLCRDLLRSYQGLIQQDEITYRLGLSLVRQARWEDGSDLLEEVTVKWPTGEFARSAAAKLPVVRERFFTVQVGAYTNKDTAESKQRELRARGFAGTLEQISIDGVPGYALRSGKFSTWQAVSEHADKLKAAGFPTYKLP